MTARAVISFHVLLFILYCTGENAQSDQIPNSIFRTILTQGNQNTITSPTASPMIDKMALETGFSDTNVWLEWIRYTVLSQKRSNCIACAAARPHLGTVPFPLSELTDPEGFKCILKMYTETIPSDDTSRCRTLELLYPIVHDKDHMGFGITPYPGNYTCFNRNHTGKDIGVFPPGYCSYNIYLNETSSDSDAYPDKWFVHQGYQHADIWWLCGDLKLRPRIRMEWIGQCTLIKVLMPFVLFSTLEWEQVSTQANVRSRQRRSLPAAFDSHVYIDAIGVPRGVPDEFKARNQIAAGFESILPIIGVNKNVGWINYLYYNQQRFVNYTRDAVKGISEQLSSSSVMALQNRLALDMILAEKGGVCKMIGSSCCTFIPNNTAPDGSITKALNGLTSLSNELEENSGINNPITSWLEQWFGNWSNVLANMLMTLVVVLVVLALIGCCVIPCFRKFFLKCSTQPHQQQPCTYIVKLTDLKIT
ncbi:endogenous retrovirus group PABLB member 1 Env polyprotein-like [Bufo bufo]|uniref:endogenous retrovirus group PABLB member 1 Env polyprotein-like n=1 Tax=Bufo bufo TaxID=8384 RepID=UPI001ABE5779|nr:endogenous retrovirus group PABLB member 1 Env polyprotein-like [Bufo bufo]